MAAITAWQLEQFLAERVERGRRLLEESEDHLATAGRWGRRAASLTRPAAADGGRRRLSCLIVNLLPACDSLFVVSADFRLQNFVDQMDLTVALHRIFLRDNCQPREGLSERDKLQASGLPTDCPAVACCCA